MIEETPASVDVLKFERRGQRREASSGTATVTYSDHDGHVGLGSVEVIDCCRNGLGVRSQSPIEAGMSVTLYPTTCGSGPSSLDGIATYCRRLKDGWLVGLRLDRRLAA